MKTERNLEKNGIKLALPIFLETLFFATLGIIGTLMPSSYSEKAAAGVGAETNIMNMFVVLLNVLSLGIGVVVADPIKEKKQKIRRKSREYQDSEV